MDATTKYLIVGLALLLLVIIFSYGIGWCVGYKQCIVKLFKRKILTNEQYRKLTQ